MENKTGSFIAHRRKELGMTQRQLAEILGVTNKAVSKWETGQGMPDIGTLPELSKVLGVTVDEILNGKEAARETLPTEVVREALPYEGSLFDLAVERAEKKMSPECCVSFWRQGLSRYRAGIF